MDMARLMLQRLADPDYLKAVQVFLGRQLLSQILVWVLRHRHSPDPPHPQGQPISLGALTTTKAFETLKIAFTRPHPGTFHPDNPIVA